jgi:hypothetical protein
LLAVGLVGRDVEIRDPVMFGDSGNFPNEPSIRFLFEENKMPRAWKIPEITDAQSEQTVW